MKKFMGFICSFGMIVSGVAYAAPIDSITQDEQGRIEIKGTFEAQGRFTVQILEPNVNADEITDENVFEKIHAVGDFETDDAGSYKEKLTMKKTAEDMAIYTVRVKSEGEKNVYEKTFKFFDVNALNSAFQSFKSAESEEKAYDIASKNAEKFGINTENYTSLSEKSQKRVASVVLKKVKEDWDLEALREEYNKQSKAEAVASGVNALEILNSDADILGISQDKSYDVFKNMNEKQQKEVAEKLKGADLTDEAAAKKSLGEAVFLVQIKNAAGLASVKEILQNNSDILDEATLRQYFAAKDTSAVDSALAGKDFKSIDAVLETINEKLAGGNKNNNSSGGGSGGSGGGLGGLGLTPNVTTGVSDDKNDLFTDLEDVAWAKEAVIYLASKGVINGRGDGIFDPNANVTREEFVKMLVLAFNLETAGAELQFADVSKEEWSYKYVSAACNSGLVNGISNDLFGKGQNITRQDMAVLVWRFVNFKGADLPRNAIAEFSDKGLISDYAIEAISALRAADVVSGMPGGEYKPFDTCTRAQAAKIIYTALLRCGLI